MACLKNMAKMDVAERRAAQDGKILRKFENQKPEFRCSTSNGKYGEGMVLRILNSDSSILDLDKFIYLKSVRDELRRIIKSTMVLLLFLDQQVLENLLLWHLHCKKKIMVS